MTVRNAGRLIPAVALGVVLLGSGAVISGAEIKGAAILQHPCGKVSVRHMGLVHDGRMADAVKLGTPELQAQWSSMPAAERDMMAGMMKAMSQSAADFSADIKAHGVLTVAGGTATLTVKKTRQDASGSATETMTQSFQIAGSNCAIAR
ncbi:MAG: hypothetical protein ACM3ST_00975 [Bdellovibrio bacteriovorus]